MAEAKFEDALSKLEEIVRKMEQGELTLDESLASFEEGIRLVGIARASSTRPNEGSRSFSKRRARWKSSPSSSNGRR